MSETNATETIPITEIPIINKTQASEPIVQCGVLYLGTVPTNNNLFGLDVFQEPFSYRYPVDGTNTVRGIDAVVSVYDNGIQLSFTRQTHAAVFFPLTSLIDCASVRFTVIENDQTKSIPMVDWRFMSLDSLTANESRHPPLFSFITKRTIILPGDECHCFITKSTDAAISLIQAVSEIYVKIPPAAKCLKSPTFYQLDRFGRKSKETSSIIYISPANDIDSHSRSRSTKETSLRRYLVNPTLGGYFYRSATSIIEQWQLWDDESSIETRPHPPASPFGLHEGIYHDDTTHEIQKYLRHMEDEEHSSSCTCSSHSCSSTSSCSTSTKNSRKKRTRQNSSKHKSSDDTDQFDELYTKLPGSFFEPIETRKTHEREHSRKTPIIIEKVVPTVPKSIPILNPLPTLQSLDIANSEYEKNPAPRSQSHASLCSYRINERGEKITKEGNRIIYMDVVRANMTTDKIDPHVTESLKSRSRSRRKHQSKEIPVIDIQQIQQFIDEKITEKQRIPAISTNAASVSSTIDIIPLTKKDVSILIDQHINKYIENKPNNLNNQDTQLPKEGSQISIKHKLQRKLSTVSTIYSSKHEIRQRRSHSVRTDNSAIDHVEHASLASASLSQTSSIPKPKSRTPSIITSEKLDEYVANIYGTRSARSDTVSSKVSQEVQQPATPKAPQPEFISPFRYMTSSVNPSIMLEFHKAY